MGSPLSLPHFLKQMFGDTAFANGGVVHSFAGNNSRHIRRHKPGEKGFYLPLYLSPLPTLFPIVHFGFGTVVMPTSMSHYSS